TDVISYFFFQAEDGIRDFHVTGVQTCALPIFPHPLLFFAGTAARLLASERERKRRRRYRGDSLRHRTLRRSSRTANSAARSRQSAIDMPPSPTQLQHTAGDSARIRRGGAAEPGTARLPGVPVRVAPQGSPSSASLL